MHKTERHFHTNYYGGAFYGDKRTKQRGGETQEEKNEEIKEMGTVDLEEGDGQGGDPHRIKLITIIGR